MDTKFYLRKQKENKESFIYFSFKDVNGKAIRISSKKEIQNKDWEDGYPKRIATTMEVRKVINNYKKKIDKFIKKNIKKIKRQPTKDELLQFINEMINGKKTQHNNTVAQYAKDFLDDDFLRLKDTTKRVKKVHLDHFIKIFGKKKTLQDLNKQVIEGYKVTLIKEGGREVVTTNNYLKNLKAFLNWLFGKDLIGNDLAKYVKKDQEILKDVIALTEKELLVLENASFEQKDLQDQLDIFLFGCYTTLSIGEMKRVRKEMINENNLLVMRRGKNDITQRIPLIKDATDILKKHDYKLPFDHRGAEHLKTIFRRLKLNRVVRISKQNCKDGIVIDEYKELSKVISWHKSRKTSITMLLTKGLSTSIVMEMSGHRKENTLLKYKGITDEDLTKEMSKIRR
jgi:integrase